MRHLVTAQGYLRAWFVWPLSFLHSGRLFAGTDWTPIDASELTMKSEPLAPGAAAVVLYRQVDRDDNGGPRMNSTMCASKF